MSARVVLLVLASSALLSACGPGGDTPLLGYVEIEPTRVAAQQAGRLVSLSVQRGGEVAAGAPLFALDTELERPALDEAEARRAQSDAQAQDLASGKRPAELDSFRAREAAARSALSLAESELARQQALAAQGFVSPMSLDSLRERVRSARAQLDQAVADLRAAELAGRESQRAAATAAVKVAEAQRAQAQTRLAQKQLAAPVAAHVEDTYYRVGEWVPAGSPVVSLLPAGSTKLRFYVPEARLAAMRPGQRIRVRCDGCGEGFTARVTWVASSAEYTPPVIYSKDNRAKLVFKAEAQPERAVVLAPGLPVDVLPEAGR
ncbi:HlyD family secretion protein [Niveibacterium sp.]|uniref:HlyD family secretion protein n=1 Tax=Niveibacterium sp. TaxID=2017444 RepID=UPI0035AEE397